MRRLAPLLLAIALFATIGVLWIVTDRRASGRVYDEFSSANTSTAGVSQAAAYLGRRGKSAMLVRPVRRTPLEANAVVFRLTRKLPLYFNPAALDDEFIGPPKPRERVLLNDAEDAFVRRGGRIVIGAHMGALPAATPATKNAEKVFPVWPGIDKLTIGEASSAFTELRPRMHAVFAAGDRVVLARERIGDGDLIVLSWPEVFQNNNLAKANHLALLAALAGQRPVYFDEVPHGILGDDGALALMAEWNLGPFLVMLCAVAALVCWRGARRVGPPEDDHRETRSDAVDLVGSLAALYGDVTTQHESLKLYHEALTRTVAHTSGLRGDALRNRVDELTGGQRTLAAINEGFMKMQVHRRTGS